MQTTQQLTQKFNSRFYTVRPDQHAYTQGGWRGCGYDSSIGVTEIAKVIKTVVKEKYPKVKLSVISSKYSGGQSLDINLMEAPFDVFNQPDASKLSGRDLTWGVEDAMKRWGYAIDKGNHGVNHYYIDNDYYITDDAKDLFNLIHEVCKYFNRDDSDSMTDYFDTNFYYSFGIGKWNKAFIKNN